MGRIIAAKKSLRTSHNRKIRQAICECLEERQMMSLTLEVRDASGGSAATVTQVGQVLNLELIAIITDANGDPSTDGLQDLNGDIESSAIDGHAVAGNLTAANIAPFNANGSAAGNEQDLNGDGNTDVGIPFSSSTTAGLYFARSSPAQTDQSSYAKIVGTSLEFEVGTLSYTVTSLNEGGSTGINFVPYVSTLPEAAGWIEDGQERDNTNGTYQAGTPYVVSDESIIPAPVMNNSSFSVVRNTPTTLDEFTGANLVVALNPASVVIVSPPTHGTASLITTGSTAGQILYTPTAGYLGADSFTYKVSDDDGRVSNTATVSVNVVLPPPPVAGAVTDTTFRNSPVTVSVVGADTSADGTIEDGTVAVATQPADGTAVAETNGTILYTPTSGFVGTDSFTYTVADSNDQTSTPGTVTITVVLPTPPVATAVSGNAYEGTPINFDLASGATSSAGTINPASILIVTPTVNGTVVPQADGTVLYTPTPGYIGTDSFVYTIDDTLGDVSNQATFSITITHAAPPVITDSVAPVLTGQNNVINVLSNASSGAPLVPSTVAIVTSPLDGKASVNASTGAITYLPNAGFVGTDSFTYTVGDVNLDTSNPATVSVNVGATLSQAKGAAHSLVFTDSAGGSETISLNRGTAEVYFDGNTGTLAIAKNGKGTITSKGLSVASITLTGTTSASALSIKGLAKDPLNIAGITDAAPLGSISAPYTNVSGAISLDSASSLTLGTVVADSLTVGAAAPGRFALTAGAVTVNGAFTSAVPITSLKVASLTVDSLTAPSIGSITDAGAFSGNTVTLHPAGKTPAISSARITGAIAGTWTVTGNLGSITAGAINSSWVGTISGAISTLIIKSGGLASNLTASSIGSLTVTGAVTSGNITAGSVSLIHVIGGITGTTLTAGAGGLRELLVSGAITNATVTSTGAIGTIEAGSVGGSNFSAGVPSTTTLPYATAANLGASVISTFRTNAFASSDILADRLGSVALGTVTASNGGAKFGIAANTIGSFSGVFGVIPARFGHAQLSTEAILQGYVVQDQLEFTDFELLIES